MACHISVRDIDFHPSTTGVRIRVITDVPSHLYLRLSLIKPLIHKQPSIRRGVAFAEDIRFCFTVFEDNEQVEPGDTINHTWWKTSWPACTTKWLYVWGSRSGEVCVSTTAPFQYHNTGIDPIEPPPPPVPELFEHYIGAAPGAWTVRRFFWNAQTFTPQANHDLTHVLLRLYRSGSDPTEKFYCQIQPTLAGKPTLPFLGQAWFLQDELPLIPAETWKEITFDPVIPLAAGVMYAIVCWTSNNVAPYAYWRHQGAGNPYPRGTQCFSYNGTTWTIQAAGEQRFQEWGFPT